MKKKILRVLFAMVLALSLSLVMAVPVAADVTTVTAAPLPTTVDTVAQYTIAFTTSETTLVSGDQVMITFPTGTTVPSSYETGDVTLEGADVAPGNISGVDQTVTITVIATIGPGVVDIIFKTAAAIVNPTTPGAYKLTVSTTKDPTAVDSALYNITATPNITAVTPSTGLKVAEPVPQAETITGTNFVDGAINPATVSFGAGISVTETTVVSLTQITCDITIAAGADVGARDVTVTTPGGTATLTGGFTVIGVPTIAKVEPPKANQGDTEDVVIEGTNLGGATIVDFGAGISVTDFTVSEDGTELTATISIAEGAAVGKRDVSVTTPADIGTEPEGFAVQKLDTPLVDVYNSDGGYLDQKDNINDAIAVTNADTLVAHAATYEEQVIIDVPSLKVESLSGADVTFIDITALGSDAWAATIAASNVTIKGFTFSLGDSKGIQVELEAGANPPGRTGITIQDNIIVGTNGGSTGIHFFASHADRPHTVIKVLGNQLEGRRINFVNVTDSTISDNILTGGGYIEFGGKCVTDDITGNNITGAPADKGAINFLTYGNPADPYTLLIEDNTLSNNLGCGIKIPFGTITNSTISENDISGNADDGIEIGSDVNWSTGNAIKYNDITGNTNYGIDNASGEVVDAKYNWFGQIGGPSADAEALETEQSEALGTGDIVSKGVVYDPWLTELQATVIADGIRSYGSDALALEKGWNTLSVPCGLKGTGDTFGDIQAMGTYLVFSGDSLNCAGGYWYNASTSAWVGIDTSTTLEPGKGFYVNMTAASTFPVLYYDGLLYLPAYDMYEGWNLVGSMFGIDRDADYGVAAVDDADRLKAVDAALDSIQATGSVVISPSVPGQVAKWATTVGGNSKNMLVGEAYWVFMTADGTLAGFEVTPFCFTPGTTP